MTNYLSDDLKNYYQKDFQLLCSLMNQGTWNLDSGLDMILSKINNNMNIHSLYSKNFNPSTAAFGATPESYLEIAFKESTKTSLINALEKIGKEINKSEPKSFEYYLFDPIYPNPNFRQEGGIGCLNNIEYFNLYHLRIVLLSQNEKTINNFWQLIEDKLLEIK